MANKTFYNLPEGKQNNIYKALKNVFESKSIKEAAVSDIIKESKMARGSFYQYFDDIYDAYFLMLKRETLEIHGEFFKLLVKEKGNLKESLNKYGEFLLKTLYDQKKRNLYKHKFLNWDEKVEDYYKKEFIEENLKDLKNPQIEIENINKKEMMEFINFIKSIIHELIKESFRNDYTREKFIEVYKLYTNWILRGVEKWENWKYFLIYFI